MGTHIDLNKKVLIKDINEMRKMKKLLLKKLDEVERNHRDPGATLREGYWYAADCLDKGIYRSLKHNEGVKK